MVCSHCTLSPEIYQEDQDHENFPIKLVFVTEIAGNTVITTIYVTSWAHTGSR